MNKEETVIVVLKHNGNETTVAGVVKNIREAVPIVESIIAYGFAWSLKETKLGA
jgi:hypothetical protein